MQDAISQAQHTRVRIKLGQFEMELEGPTAFEEFRRIAEEGIGKLGQTSAPPTWRAGSPAPDAPVPSLAAEPDAPPTGLPSLSDLALKDVAKSEREWVAVYGLYLSEGDGKRAFSRGDVWEKYKTSGRDNDSRQANLSENINRAVKAGWLTKIKENTYALLPAGKAEAEEIVARTGPSKKSSIAPRKARAQAA